MNQYEYRDPTRFIYNEYINQTSMHPIAIGLLIAVVVMLFVVRTKYWFFLLACLICMTGSAQRIVIAGVDFQMLRLIGVGAEGEPSSLGAGVGASPARISRRASFGPLMYTSS